jgi:hypothetical protein
VTTEQAYWRSVLEIALRINRRIESLLAKYELPQKAARQ